MTDKSEDAVPAQPTPCEHQGIFTIGGNIPILGAWRDITFVPVRDNIWSVSEGIYRSIFLKGKKGVIAFDTLTTPAPHGRTRPRSAGYFPPVPSIP